MKTDNEGEIFANHVSDKEFMSRICKEHLKFDNEKNNPIRRAKDMKQYFFEKFILITNKHMKDVQHHQPLGKRKLRP